MARNTANSLRGGPPSPSPSPSSSTQTDASSSGRSYSAAAVADSKKTVRRCCRKVVAFMCTQVGVGGLIVGYAVAGAFGFGLIEGAYRDPKIEEVARATDATVRELWRITAEYNVLERDQWNAATLRLLAQFQNNVSDCVKGGYNGAPKESTWTFPAALMFCLSVFTMIGYGNMVPRTVAGKAATLGYAVFGIPLYVLYLKNMGRVLSQTFRWTYTWIYRCSMEDVRPDANEQLLQQQPPPPPPPPKRVIVPSTACLWVLFAYVATGTAMFSSWQSWSVMDSAYFCVTSLCKIGLDDYAADHILAPAGGDPTRLVATFAYLLFGMGIIAMCYDLMKEDVTVRVRSLKNDIVLCFEDIQSRAVDLYKRRNSYDYD